MAGSNIIVGTRLKEILREEVKGALEKQELKTSEMAEFYLVNLLNDFHAAELACEHYGEVALEKPLALIFMEATKGDLPERVKVLRHLGDSALVIAGFFADSIRRTLVDLSYYVSMGETAYTSLADILSGQKTFCELYAEMADKFEDFAQVLQIIAPWNRDVSNTNLIRIYERWLATGDRKLEDLLNQQGIQTCGANPALKLQ